MELKNFKIEVVNKFLMKDYEISDTENVSIINSCLGKEGLKFIQTLVVTHQEACTSSVFKPEHNEIISY